MKKETPKDGDYRYHSTFAWYPMRFNGYWVWMEKITIRQTYLSHGLLFPRWINICLSNSDTGISL